MAVRKHGEAAVIVEVFTGYHGKHAGVVRGGAGRKQAPMLQPGGQFEVVWKARLEETEENDDEGRTEKTKTGDECARRERRITSGAGTVIKNVLPFLQLS